MESIFRVPGANSVLGRYYDKNSTAYKSVSNVLLVSVRLEVMMHRDSLSGTIGS
jgi:hypothetical protein